MACAARRDPVSPPTIEPVEGATFGTVITDIDLTQLSGHTWRTVEDAFLEYAVLVFPAQHLGADAQVAFGRRFGEIETLRGGRQRSGAIQQQEARWHPAAAGRLPLQGATRKRRHRFARWSRLIP